MRKVFIYFVILIFTVTTLFVINSFLRASSNQEFIFEVKSAYQNNSEVIHIKIPHLKPEYVLNVILKSKGNVVLKKKYRGITNCMISLDKNSGVKELTKYGVTLKIINSRNNKILFVSNPFQIFTGKTNENFFKEKTSNKIKSESKRLNKEFLSRNKAIENLFLNDSFPLKEYCPVNDTVYVYGISYFSKMNHFISINLHSKEKKILNKFPEITGIPMQASSIDDKNGRYFFIGHVKNTYFLYVLDIFSGKILKKHKLENHVTLFEYNRTSDKLVGISRIFGSSNKLIELNILPGKIGVIEEIPGLSGIPMVPAKIDYNKNSFLFFGHINDHSKLISANISTGDISFIDSYQIGTNSYRIHSFDSNQLIDIIYTYGVQSCSGIVGCNKEYNVGFIVHFFPNFNNIPSILEEIDQGLNKRIGSGLSHSHMKIVVVGGQKYNSNSFNNVITIYRELLQKYHVKYDRAKVYHLGRSYNIILNAGNIDIF